MRLSLTTIRNTFPIRSSRLLSIHDRRRPLYYLASKNTKRWSGDRLVGRRHTAAVRTGNIPPSSDKGVPDRPTCVMYGWGEKRQDRHALLVTLTFLSEREIFVGRLPRTLFQRSRDVFDVPEERQNTRRHPHEDKPHTSAYARTAFLTHRSHGHSTLPVPMPLSSLQMTAPHVVLKCSEICRVRRTVPLPLVTSPATSPAPPKAPQVASILPMPKPKSDAG